MFVFRGRTVVIPGPAEVPSILRYEDDGSPDAVRLRQEVQSYLDALSSNLELVPNTPMCRLLVLDRVRLNTEVVPVDETSRIIWGVNTKHTAYCPQASPFVDQIRLLGDTEDLLCVEFFIASNRALILTRAYAGEYQPPLPWMKSVRKAPGGHSASVEYWNAHAFVRRPNSFRELEPDQQIPPEWWKPMS